jgi:hypothetical protein
MARASPASPGGSAREAPPLHAYEVSLRARELARLRVRVRAGPPGPRLAVVRAPPAQAEPARGR